MIQMDIVEELSDLDRKVDIRGKKRDDRRGCVSLYIEIIKQGGAQAASPSVPSLSPDILFNALRNLRVIEEDNRICKRIDNFFARALSRSVKCGYPLEELEFDVLTSMKGPYKRPLNENLVCAWKTFVNNPGNARVIENAKWTLKLRNEKAYSDYRSELFREKNG